MLSHGEKCKSSELKSRYDQGSISSTFYKQLLLQYSCAEKLQSQTASIKSFWRKNIDAKAGCKMRQYSFAKKIQSQTVSTNKLLKTLSYEKAGHKMLMKLTPLILSVLTRPKDEKATLTEISSTEFLLHPCCFTVDRPSAERKL